MVGEAYPGEMMMYGPCRGQQKRGDRSVVMPQEWVLVPMLAFCQCSRRCTLEIQDSRWHGDVTWCMVC
jgi:hypothetical protein